MDIVVEENGLGFLAGGERWWLFLDGIISISRYEKDTWTIYHWNGSVINVTASVISPDQLAHLRAAAERGKTPEGIGAVIERGRKLEAMMNSANRPPGETQQSAPPP
jgi:hypothetical protein